jgi:MFS family permease
VTTRAKALRSSAPPAEKPVDAPTQRHEGRDVREPEDGEQVSRERFELGHGEGKGEQERGVGDDRLRRATVQAEPSHRHGDHHGGHREDDDEEGRGHHAMIRAPVALGRSGRMPERLPTPTVAHGTPPNTFLPMTPRSVRLTITDWLARWRPVLPLFVSEAIVWIGFGALLPVVPLYFTEQGLDLATLGIVIAAWPAARLVGEPVFGWLADRTARVPLMVTGLAFSGLFCALPLAIHGAAAFLAFRALSGLATALYDPAARGVLIDATSSERHGEAFGWYGAAQMSGLLLGPAIGGLGASLFGGTGFVFVFGGVTGLLAALAVALTVRDVPRHGSIAPLPGGSLVDFSRDVPHVDDSGDPTGATTPPRPTSLRNRVLASAVIANAAGNYGGGTYDVIWSLFLQAKGASLGLISLSFTMFAVPMLLFGPFFGRLVDRRGSLRFIVIGSSMIGLASLGYTFIVDPAWSIAIILFEATGFSMLIPALYAVVARGSPEGRSSTAQGIFGGAGTVGFVIASLVTGWLAGIDLRYPFYVFSGVTLVTLLLTLAIGRRAILAGEPGRATPRGADEATALETDQLRPVP